MTTYSTRDEAIEREIVAALAEYAADYDIEAIADEVLGDYGEGYVCKVDTDTFWEVVAKHDRSAVVVADLPPLTDAEFRIAREDLGLTAEWVAEQLGVALRTVRRWESGHSPVPEGVADRMGEWTDYAEGQVGEWAGRLPDVPEPVLVIPRDGERDRWPAGWWRALAARIVERVDGLRVVYADE